MIDEKWVWCKNNKHWHSLLTSSLEFKIIEGVSASTSESSTKLFNSLQNSNAISLVVMLYCYDKC